VWTLWRAKSTSTVDRGDLATIAYGSGATQFNCLWPISGGYPSATVMSTGSSVENSIDYYVGGFQIERITSDGKYGFAAIGDSTTQLNGVTAFVDRDYAESQDWPGFLAAHLNVQGFNRGIGGNTAAMMDARWASDITPIAARCKYVLIQPSWHNDRDTALVDIQTSVNSMVAKAVADGLIPVLVVPDPSSAIATNPGTYQAHYDALVAWVRTFPLVLDGGAVVSDPWDRYSLRPDYYLSDADQVHCNFAGNKAKARAFAAATFWDFPRPSPYQKITTNTYTAPDLSIYGGTKQIMGINRAAHVATLTSGTVTVSNTRITASSRVRLTRQAKNASSAIGNLTLGTITAGTSFVITALKADGTTETGDASTVLWEIIEPTP
jgi:lysophospholipase L1-like esterase